MTCPNCKPTICGCNGNEKNFKCLYYKGDTLTNINVEEDDNGEEILEKIDAAIGDAIELANGVLPAPPETDVTGSTTSTEDVWILTYNYDTGLPEYREARITMLS